MSDASSSQAVVYEAPDRDVRIDVPLGHETVWPSLNRMPELFGRNKSMTSSHLRDVFTAGGLERVSAVARTATESQPAPKDLMVRLVLNLLEDGT